MAYSGWRFSCDRATMERCAGALEIRAKDYAGDVETDGDMALLMSAFAKGAATALRAIIADGDGIDPAEYVGQVMARAEAASRASAATGEVE